MSDVSVMSIIKTESGSQGLDELIKETEINKKQPQENPETLHLESIRMAHSVFQPRQFLEGTVSASGSHIQNLVEAIFNEPTHTLDPITVWWSGNSWKVIDGAHRLIAYRIVSQKGKLKNPMIPVKVFHGDLYKAIMESVKLNSKDKLQMTRSDKTNAAWRMTVIEKLSKRDIHISCKVGVTTVSRMRNVLTKIKDKYPKRYKQVALTYTWEKALQFDIGETVRDDSWEDLLAKNWARRLAKDFGNKAATQPNTFAKAIEIYSTRLPGSLAEYWGYVDEEVRDIKMKQDSLSEEISQINEGSDF